MSKAPIHLAIIPDGNRRWAKERGLLPWKGHEKAVDVLKKVSEWCLEDQRIGILTMWLFSTENWKRDPQEVAKLMTMLKDFIEKERKNWHKKQIRFVHSGRTDRIPADLAALITEVEAETYEYDRFTLHMALDYGGKDEIIRSANRVIASGAELTEESLREHVDCPELPDIDLIVRTSGEHRVSNFFLWQGAYSEWMFLPKFLPDLTTADIEDALEEFNDRTRRFGG